MEIEKNLKIQMEIQKTQIVILSKENNTGGITMTSNDIIKR
jgi:hypothetical protein